MKGFILLSLFAFSCVLSAEIKSIDPRHLSLFGIVKFENVECQAKSDATLTGTCFSDTECSDKGGEKDGNCAQGFGSCCVFKTATCGATVSYNNSYVENPGYPKKFDTTLGSSPCEFKVSRMEGAKICQIRLDFTDFELTGPTAATGNCGSDTFVATPGAANAVAQQKPPTLCGTNTGHHVYMDAGEATTAATLAFTVAANSDANWRVKVSQIECSSVYLPPNGCLQYYMGVKNTVTSFNYDGTTTAPYGMLQNQDYNVCFKPEKGMCSMQYVENAAATDSFQLHLKTATTALGRGTTCTNGGLQIPVENAEYGVFFGVYCGTILASVDSAATAKVIPGRAGAFNFRHYAGATQDTLAGFSIDATQVPC